MWVSMSGSLRLRRECLPRLKMPRYRVVIFDANLTNLETRLDSKIDKLPWMLGLLMAMAVANFAKEDF